MISQLFNGARFHTRPTFILGNTFVRNPNFTLKGLLYKNINNNDNFRSTISTNGVRELGRNSHDMVSRAVVPEKAVRIGKSLKIISFPQLLLSSCSSICRTYLSQHQQMCSHSTLTTNQLRENGNLRNNELHTRNNNGGASNIDIEKNSTSNSGIPKREGHHTNGGIRCGNTKGMTNVNISGVVRDVSHGYLGPNDVLQFTVTAFVLASDENSIPPAMLRPMTGLYHREKGSHNPEELISTLRPLSMEVPIQTSKPFRGQKEHYIVRCFGDQSNISHLRSSITDGTLVSVNGRLRINAQPIGVSGRNVRNPGDPASFPGLAYFPYIQVDLPILSKEETTAISGEKDAAPTHYHLNNLRQTQELSTTPSALHSSVPFGHVKVIMQ